MKQHPSHPGANHYYIHTMEASGYPEKGLASAERLGKLMPGVSHVVHMPSHIYIRTGNYGQGEVVNEKAVKGFETYMSLYPDVVNNAPLYSIHNLHMQSACAQMNGNYAYAIKSSDDCRNSFDTSFMSLPSPLDGYTQFVYMTPVFTQIRFGRWDEILAAPGVPENYIYAHLLRHFAKGLAYARKNDATNAKRELKQMMDKVNEPMMLVRFGPFNTPQAGARVAEEILQGAIAEAENDLSFAISHYQQAVKNEDAMIYDEPKDWLLPAREYLGAVQLKAGQNIAAEKTFREDLKENPHNGWSLYGLYQSLVKQKKTSEALQVLKQFNKAFAKADIKISSPVF